MAESAPIRLSWSRLTHVGARAANQDALGDACAGDLACFVLADGAGGHAGGEVAAHTVVQTMLAAFQAAPGAPAIERYAAQATLAVHAAQQNSATQRDMSTTLATVIIDCASARSEWLHLGDSRIYLFRSARLIAQTRDHSVTQQFIDAGLAKAGELRQHPQRNLLYGAVGAHGDTAPARSQHDLAPGDALLLCSDGLWEWVNEAQMEAALVQAATSAAWLDALCALAASANAASGKPRDNYSAYAIFVEAP